MTLALLPFSLLLVTALAQVPAPGRRILAADDSKHLLAVIRADGTFEREEKISSIHNAQLLPNGNLLYQRDGWNDLVEKSPDGQIVWSYNAGKANPGKEVEVHGFQRLADGNTMVVESGVGRIIEITPEGKVAREIPLKVKKNIAHHDSRLAVKLETGNYLVAQEGDSMVKEYAPDGMVVWEFEIPMFGKEPKGGHGPEAFGNNVFSAIRLLNGNTLIGTGNGHSVLEVSPKKEIVWQVHQNDLPGITLAWVCRVQRLKNGNTVIGNCHAGPENPQLIEITPDKKVVWQWREFSRFGNSTPVAILLE